MTSSQSSAARQTFAAAVLHPRDFALILLQLALLIVLVWQFQLEPQRHLLAAFSVAVGGFAIHAWLPTTWRRLWFVTVSIFAIGLVLGPVQAAYLLAVSAALITVAVAPLAFWLRVAMVGGLAAGCFWLRRDSTAAFWPIVGSMFMFRAIVYLQTVRQERGPATLLETCSYFFLLPNAFFPLFPVVDYVTFRATYYNDERRRIYQTGVHWLATGILHLVLYRLIKHELLLTPLEIRTATDMAQYLAMNYALYVRVSGQFHIVCGMLHLFGFHLPRTHDAYFLASSFSDIWRRINIYWKDFMAKSFFFPAFFRARSAGDGPAVIAAVLWVFLWTWLGHSWQAFWLLGDFPLRSQDMLLWLGVGALVAINGVIDYRRARRPAPSTFSLVRASVHALQVLGVFACVSVFWAQWSNPEVLKLLFFSTYVLTVTARDVSVLGGVALFAVIIGVIYQYATRKPTSKDDHGIVATFLDRRRLDFDQSVGWHLVPLIVVLLCAQPPVYGLLGGEAAKVIAGLQVERISRGEALAQIAGYYEELNDNALQAGPFLGDPRRRKSAEMVDFADMIQLRDDMLDHDLIPNWKGTWHGATMTINRWGMRDKDRTLVKPPNTARIALVGSSLVMGYGVNDNQTFARLLEDRLNSDPPLGKLRYDVLNFGVGRYSPLHRRLQIERKVLPFQPDLIVYFAHQDELYSSTGHIGPALSHGLELSDPCLEQVVRDAGIKDRSSEALMDIQLRPHHVDILRCIYRGMIESSRTTPLGLLYVYLPIPGEHELPFDPRVCLQLAAEAGMPTADLSHWEGEHAPGEVLLNDANHHANVLGHRLLTAALEPLLRKQLDRTEKIRDR